MLKFVKIRNTNNVKGKNAQHTHQTTIIKQVISTKMQGMQKMDYTQKMPKYAKNGKNTKYRKYEDQRYLNELRNKTNIKDENIQNIFFSIFPKNEKN